MAATPAIVCIGELLWQVSPTGRQPGGAPFHTAVQLRQLGQPVQLLSGVGDDELGQELLHLSTRLGLDISLIQQSSRHLTGVAKGAMASPVPHPYPMAEPVAWDDLRCTPEAQAAVQRARAVVYGSLVARQATSRETLYRLLLRAAYRVFDVRLQAPHYRREVVKYLLRQADFVLLDTWELAELLGWLGQPATEATALPWLAGHFGLHALCLLKDTGGAALWLDNQLFDSPGEAGGALNREAFLAMLLSGLLAQHPPADCLHRACAASALAQRAPASEAAIQ